MRSNVRFSRFSAVAILIALAFLAVGGGRLGGNSTAAQGATTEATMAGTGGAIPPCPEVAMATESAATESAATESAMATMSATMSATMDAAMQEMVNNACHYYADLSSAEENPPTVPNGIGEAELHFSRPATGSAEVCYIIHVEGIKLPATAAHIHRGARGVNGPVVVPFSPAPDASGNAQGCVAVADNALFMDILTNPSNYYVNVHNADFPGGVVRGQIEPDDHDATGTK